MANDKTNHYCLIKNLRGLIRKQTGNQHRHYCRRCLNGFRLKEYLEKHQEYCDLQAAVKIPRPGTILSFNNYKRSMRVPFVVYADFESFIKPIDTCQPDPKKSYTKPYQKHSPSSFCYYVKCFDDKMYSQEPVTFSAQSENNDVAQIFVDKLKEDIRRIYKLFQLPKRMIFTAADKKKFIEATTCHICEKALSDDRVRDHCHLSGKYREAAHKSVTWTIENHGFTLLYCTACPTTTVTCSSKSWLKAEKRLIVFRRPRRNILAFQRRLLLTHKEGKRMTIKRELRFIDSFKFMASSLYSLSKNLTKEQCKNIGNRYSGKQLELLSRKGIYPYDYMDSLVRLSETKLPPKEAFYLKLNSTDISDEDYQHAQTVFKEFGCETSRDYHNLYNISDVL